ncbi:MAG: hypothetical protein RH862_17570 [Leptospiraceae bacterium]
MQIQELISKTFFRGDVWIVSVSVSLAILLLVILMVYALIKWMKRPGSRPRKAPSVIKTAASAEKSQPGDSQDQQVSKENSITEKAETGKEPQGQPSETTAQPDYSWIQEAEIRPVAAAEPRAEEATGFMPRDDSTWKDQSGLPAAWRESSQHSGADISAEPLAPILDLKSQMVDAALISIPEYPVPIGQSLSSARQPQSSGAPAAISREDGLFDVYRNVSFLRSHLRSGLDPADLFFSGMGGDVAVNSHPYVLFLPEFAHDPDIRRRTENILQTAAAGYMQRGLDKLASVEKEAVAWTIRFLFWKGRLDKAMSLLYRFAASQNSELNRIRSLLAACLEDSLLHRVYSLSESEAAGYDRALMGIPSESIRGLRSSLAFQGATDTEDFQSLRPFTELDRRNARWLYLHLLHRGHLFMAFRLCYQLSKTDVTFEDELLYLAGIQGRYRLMLRILLELPARNSFFRLAVLKHGMSNLAQEDAQKYLHKLQKHWPEATEEALESVEPFAEFQGADTMRRSPGNILGSIANPMDRSELLDWMDLAAYRSRSGFHAGGLNRAAVLLYTVLRSHRNARPGFEQRARRFFEKAARMSNVARHYYVLWLKDTEQWQEARYQAEYFIRHFPDLEYFHEQFVSLSR